MSVTSSRSPTQEEKRKKRKKEREAGRERRDGSVPQAL